MRKLIIDNKIKLIDIPPEITKQLIKLLTFRNPKYDEAAKYGRYLRNINPYITLYSTTLDGIIIPRGFLNFVEENLLNKGYNFTIEDHRVLLPPISVDSNIVLKSYQKKPKSDMLKHPNGMLIAPAGSGKTVIGIDIFATVKQKMLWLTHTNRLANQTKERMIEMLPDVSKDSVGEIGDGKWKTENDIVIGMVQSLIRNPGKLNRISKDFGLIILDECHHLPANTFLKVINNFSSYYLYGLTATPYRRDKLENVMFATIGKPNAKIERADIEQEKGIITPTLVVREIPVTVWHDNDYHYILQEIVIPSEYRSDLIAYDVIKEARDNNYCIVISTRKIYCEILYKKISKYWVKTGIATGDYSRKHNNEQVQKLEDGNISVLVTTFDLLGEGFDVKKLNRGFIALPFREKARVEQAVGRIQRTCKNKADAILYDYVDINIGILKNQFLHRLYVYNMLGIKENRST